MLVKLKPSNCILPNRSTVLGILILSFTCISADIPGCPYEDTVDISDSIKYQNGSHLYRDVLLPPSLVGVYDYEEIFYGERVPVPPHNRGCVCQLRPCVKFCCHPKSLKVDGMRECEKELNEELEYSPYVNITADDGTQKTVHVLDDFIVQQGVPCDVSYPLIPEYDDKWELFENGTLLRYFDRIYLSKRDYCLMPHEVGDIYVLNPINCPLPVTEPIPQLVNLIVMLISIPFLLATTLVYIFIPELRKLHGKCLICYLICLAMGFTLFILHSLLKIDFSDVVCGTLGFFNYYFFMAAFCWLTVISFDLWHNFHATNSKLERLSQRKRFWFYSLFAWSVPLFMTCLTVMAQLSDLNESLKPGIGGDKYCWFKVDEWSAMIYFYGPTLILMSFNLTMFILTSVRIYVVKRELRRVVAPEERVRNLKKYKDNFGLYLRLFIVMGVSWLLEGISYMVGSNSDWSKLFYILDVCNAAQGIIIFILFVCKPSIWALIKKRHYFNERESLKESFLARKSSRSLKSAWTSRE